MDASTGVSFGLALFLIVMWYVVARKLWATYLEHQHKRDMPFRTKPGVWIVACVLWPLVLIVFFIGALITACYSFYLNRIARKQAERRERDDVKPM